MKKTLLLTTFTITFALGNSNVVYEDIYVQSSKPVYKDVVVKTPQEICYEKEVATKVPTYENTNTIGIDTLIGATAGVVIGNQIGNGSGRDAAKIIGGILGATTANKMREPNYHTQYKTQMQCETRYEKHYETKLIGYENYFYLNGKEHMKFSKQKLESVRVKLSYSY